MKKLSIKTTAVSLALITAALGAGLGVSAVSANEKKENVSKAYANTKNDNKEKNDVNCKDETVYVLSKANGRVKKIIVSDWLKNVLSSALLNDSSQLENIVNVKGEETFSTGENGSKVWNAEGGDIYYTGETDKELPVTMSVKYFLDGKELSPEEIKGKSGKVSIRFEYANNQYENVKIDGKEEKIYVPFAVLTGAMLDNEVFRNVEVSEGKVINDGDKTVVVGYALPGMQNSLKLDKEKLEIPDSIEIRADVKNFSLSETVTVVTNEIFNNIDIDNVDSADDLEDALNKLSDAVNQLSDGSVQLYDGLNTLLQKSSELIEGIDKLVEGAESLKNGTSDLAEGSAKLADGSIQVSKGSKQLADGSSQVLNGSKDLSDGLDTLTQNSAALCEGSKQVFDSFLSSATNQLREAGLTIPDLTIENYRQVLEQVLSSLNEEDVTKLANERAREKVTEAVMAKEDEIKAAVSAAVREEVLTQVKAAVRENVEAQVLSSLGFTKEQYEAAVKAGMIPEEQQKQITSAIDAQMESDNVKALIAQKTDEKMQSDETTALISQKVEEQEQLLIEQNMNSPEVQAQIRSAVESALAAEEKIKSLIAQLDSYNQFYTGLNQYTAGVGQAAEGAAKLASGAADLNSGAKDLSGGTDTLQSGAKDLAEGAAKLDNGAKQLYDGLLTLKNNTPALIDGITRLRDGAKELSQGMKEFKEQGVQKLIDAVDGDIAGLVDRLKAAVDVSKRYNIFTGLDDNMEGSVKFIYRTDSIKTE